MHERRGPWHSRHLRACLGSERLFIPPTPTPTVHCVRHAVLYSLFSPSSARGATGESYPGREGRAGRAAERSAPAAGEHVWAHGLHQDASPQPLRAERSLISDRATVHSVASTAPRQRFKNPPTATPTTASSVFSTTIPTPAEQRRLLHIYHHYTRLRRLHLRHHQHIPRRHLRDDVSYGTSSYRSSAVAGSATGYQAREKCLSRAYPPTDLNGSNGGYWFTRGSAPELSPNRAVRPVSRKQRAALVCPL